MRRGPSSEGVRGEVTQDRTTFPEPVRPRPRRAAPVSENPLKRGRAGPQPGKRGRVRRKRWVCRLGPAVERRADIVFARTLRVGSRKSEKARPGAGRRAGGSAPCSGQGPRCSSPNSRKMGSKHARSRAGPGRRSRRNDCRAVFFYSLFSIRGKRGFSGRAGPSRSGPVRDAEGSHVTVVVRNRRQAVRTESWWVACAERLFRALGNRSLKWWRPGLFNRAGMMADDQARKRTIHRQC